jgi:outer membrane receptor protein involved in Fe transport
MEALTLKYIYTRAYVAPAPYFANATYDNGQLLATSNPNLTPEKATTHEVNLDYRAKTVHLGASGYYGEQQDIVTVSDFGAPENIVAQDVYLNGDPAQHRVLAHSVNGGCGRRYGADLYGQATLGAVSVWCSYSYVDSEQTQQGVTRQVPGLSRHNGRMGVTWAATERLFITPSAVVRSTPESIPAGALADELRDPWEINLNVLYEVNPHVDVFATVRNVTDHHYALAGFGDNGKAIPQETLNGVIGLRGSF